MGRDFGGLLLDEPCQITFDMLGPQHRGGGSTQRGLSRRINLEFSHAPGVCKQGTTLAYSGMWSMTCCPPHAAPDRCCNVTIGPCSPDVR